MSRWHYQIMRHTADSGETYLAIHEFYVTHDKKETWTQRPVALEAETVSELRVTLLNVLRDLENYGVRDAADGAIVHPPFLRYTGRTT